LQAEKANQSEKYGQDPASRGALGETRNWQMEIGKWKLEIGAASF
jgi:hypothetical protein